MNKLLIVLIFFITPYYAIAQDFKISNTPITTSEYEKYQSISLQPYNQLDVYALSKDFIKNIIRNVADYQIKKYGDHIPTRNWLVSTFYSSFIGAYEATNDESYLKQALDWSQRSGWDINNSLNADDICSGQIYLDLYFIKKDPKMISNLAKKIPESYFNRTELKPGELHTWDQKSHPFSGRNIWSWCDALYMAPPMLARMGKATGDKRYYDILHDLYWDSTDFLYDLEAHLFFRNSKADLEKLSTPNGKKVFWSRGNGWVYAGLPRIIEFLEDEDPMKEKYIQLFKEMSYSIAQYQMEDGLWRSSLNDPEWFPTKESSGSSFFVFGIVKGINEGWLPKEYFLPIVLKAWTGLISCVTPEGKLGYGQNVAGSPNEVRPHDNVDYATGAFILAASELYKMNAIREIKKIWNNDFTPRLVAKDAAWISRANDPVIYSDYIYFPSYVKANGELAFTAFCTNKWPNVSAYARKQLYFEAGNKGKFNSSPSILPIERYNLLAMSDGQQCNINTPIWGDMFTDKYSTTKSKPTETIESLIQLKKLNNRIYNFTYNIDGKPTISYTIDTAKVWSKKAIYLSKNVQSVHYVSNEDNRVDIIYSTGNTIRHIYFEDEIFYDSNRKKIGTLQSVQKSPIKASKGTIIHKDNQIWIQDIEYNDQSPVCAFLTHSGGISSYKIAHLTNDGWSNSLLTTITNNITNQADFTGGLTLLPRNSSTIVISSNTHLKTKKELPNRKYQLFKGIKVDKDWKWQQLTFDPTHDHMRPTIVHGEEDALFWVTGNYINSTNFDTDILMSHNF